MYIGRKTWVNSDGERYATKRVEGQVRGVKASIVGFTDRVWGDFDSVHVDVRKNEGQVAVRAWNHAPENVSLSFNGLVDVWLTATQMDQIVEAWKAEKAERIG